MDVARVGRNLAAVICLYLAGSLLLPTVAAARTAKEINASVDAALARFQREVKGSTRLLQMAKGVLVFTDVIKAGIGIGGEFGEGALRIRNKTVAYYEIASASVGFQLGAQKRNIIIVFLDANALKDFRASEGWQVGVNGSVVLINLGAEASIDTSKIKEPIVGFVVGQEGLMYNLTLEGSKITKVQR